MEEKAIDYFRKYESIIPDFERFLASLLTPQPYWLRVNTLKISTQKLIERLLQKGFVLEQFGNLNAYKIIEKPVKHPGATLEYSLGYYYIQDLSSMAPVLALNPSNEDTVLDMAAAPGSKTTMMAELMRNEGLIVANDINFNRIKSLAGNIERLGITDVILTQKDARVASFGLKFSKILLDAPCSGEGVYRKNPWGFKGVNERQHRYLGMQQMRMFKNASNHLEEGGIIVYSTCTYHPYENESVVKYAIEKLNLAPIKVKIPIPHTVGVDRWKDETYEFHEDCIRIYPHMVDTGGMFIAVLAKE
ncbi:MAG: RsmB/NOP family class I SAM-dependent RNA methyltransferase [Thermotogae bacterium]|nr:MAG: RsmB/NOP family class I SAM-dependent RNA methyltransferase [Thermotogota bacterium]